MFNRYLERWNLEPDGEPVTTRFSRLLPVRRDGVPAMLKIAMFDEERQGGILMEWWEGEGAAQVLARDGDGLLLERVSGTRSLAGMARHGEDEEATRILCAVAATLHTPRSKPFPPGLVPLGDWFAPLGPAARVHGGIVRRAAETARDLLASPQDAVVLHGDLHHGNVLDGGARGWLAIDPKGLIGERGFDFANIFRNPEHAFGADRERLARQASVVSAATGIERTRILQWVLAFCGLSAVWVYGDPAHSEADRAMAETDLALAESAAAALDFGRQW